MNLLDNTLIKIQNVLRFLVYLVIFNTSIVYSQPKLYEVRRYFDSLSFSKFSADKYGIWAISGDSNKVFQFTFSNNQLKEYPQLNAATSKKFTCILTKGTDKVFVGTAGDYLLQLNDSIVTKINSANGILNGNINSMFGDDNYTIMGTDKGAFSSSNNMSFIKSYDSITYILNDSLNSYSFFESNALSYIIGNKRIYDPIYNSDFTLYYNDDRSYYATLIHLDTGEIPRSITIDHEGYSYIYLASNKGIRFYYGETYNLYRTNVKDTPAFKVLYLKFPYFIAASKSGVDIVYASWDSISVTPLIKDTAAYDMSNYSSERLLWIATSKGLILMSDMSKPFITSYSFTYPDTILLCNSDVAPLSISGYTKFDSIIWYRNNSLAGFPDTNLVYIDQPGLYYAVVYNQILQTRDTTNKIRVLEDFIPPYNFYYNGNGFTPNGFDTIKVCKDYSTSFLFSSYYTNTNFQWLKSGVPFGTINPTYIYFTSPGYYSVSVTNCNNFTHETPGFWVDTVDFPYFNFNLASPQTICGNGSINLIVNTNATSFYASGPLFYSDQKNMSISNPGYYTFYYGYQNISGCDQSTDFTFNAVPLSYVIVENTGDALKANSSIRNSNGEVVLHSKINSYQWYLNDTIIPNAIDSIIRPMSVGYYKVNVIDNHGCSSFSQPYKITNVDIQNSTYNQFQVFPNPTKGHITIIINKAPLANTIIIYNLLGEKTKVIENINKQIINIDIGDFPDGVYKILLISNIHSLSSKTIVKHGN